MSTELSEIPPYEPEVPVERRRQAFREGAYPVAVYGLGKMGLPLAGVFGEVTGNVIGVDVDERVASAVDAGECHVDGEPGLESLISRLAARDALGATDDPVAAARAARMHVVIVPTLLTDSDEPDLAALENAIRSIGSGLSAGDMVVVESTVPPGTTAEVVEPTLRAESGLDADSFGLAFCPERTASGRALRDIRGAYPKVVGGVDEDSTATAAFVYGEITDNEVVPVSDARTAESVKVFEGLYRDVNIALANELATLVDDLAVDVREAIEVANTQPFCDIHTPGPGVGGHCIPVYPYFVTSRVDTGTPLLETARSVNDRMPGFVVDKLLEQFAPADRPVDNASILLLGLTYRAGVAETRHAPARDVATRLANRGLTVDAVDPMLEPADVDDWPVSLRPLTSVSDAEYDGVVYLTDHDDFEELAWSAIGDAVVVDCRQALPADVGTRVYTIGAGAESTGSGERE